MELKNMVKAWDKEINQMCNVVFIDFIKPQIGLHCVGYGSYCKHPNDVIILRNTGLKDKNGVAIYEGDILEYTSNFRGREDTDILVVWWSDMDSAFLMGGIRTDYAIRGSVVIGNIYENPELIE